jgi:hypothetical protein
MLGGIIGSAVASGISGIGSLMSNLGVSGQQRGMARDMYAEAERVRPEEIDPIYRDIFQDLQAKSMMRPTGYQQSLENIRSLTAETAKFLRQGTPSSLEAFSRSRVPLITTLQDLDKDAMTRRGAQYEQSVQAGLAMAQAREQRRQEAIQERQRLEDMALQLEGAGLQNRSAAFADFAGLVNTLGSGVVSQLAQMDELGVRKLEAEADMAPYRDQFKQGFQAGQSLSDFKRFLRERGF